MSRLLILTTPGLAVGYRLAGATTFEVATPDEAQTRLEELLQHETGVIAVHAPYFDALSRPIRQRLDLLRAPLVVPLPAGTAAARPEDRRQRLLALLRQAIGYEITFGKDGATR